MLNSFSKMGMKPSNVETTSIFLVGGEVSRIRDNQTEASEKVYISESR